MMVFTKGGFVFPNMPHIFRSQYRSKR